MWANARTESAWYRSRRVSRRRSVRRLTLRASSSSGNCALRRSPSLPRSASTSLGLLRNSAKVIWSSPRIIQSRRRSRLGRLRVMSLRALQHGVVRRRLVFVVVWIDVIFAHRIILEAVPHQDAAQVGMALQNDAVEIEDFALLKFAATPDRREGRQTHWVD